MNGVAKLEQQVEKLFTLAADNLQRMGYRNVASVAGGWRAWCAAGLPTTVRG